LTGYVKNDRPEDRFFCVEAGCYRVSRSARLLMRFLFEKSIPCRLVLDAGLYRVRAGRFVNEEDAKDYLVLFEALGVRGAKVVVEYGERRRKEE